ncbi:MAG: amino acid adenylation domain-containing protein [Lachnospiraceae bacterium]|nr:amino acid adenylation domain-containing protein [Lachnospiraceae bacterium]
MARIVTDYLEDLCKKIPDKIAISEENDSISFANLRKNARRIATVVAKTGLLRKSVVIYLDKGIGVIESFLGCAYSGNFYTPMDTEMPMSRVQSIIDTLEPSMIITSENYLDKLSTINHTAKVCLISDMLKVAEDDNLINSVLDRITNRDVLYVLFTSGSTGKPKGVIISHNATINYTEWASEAFNITEHDILGNQTPFYFSMSVFDIYQMLSRGCTLDIIPKELFSRPKDILDYIVNRKINMIYWVPSALNLVAKSGALNDRDMGVLKKILFAGEVMPNSVLNIWRKAIPDAFYANLFGPTELTDICTYYVVDRDFKDDEPLPIGKACKNADILVLDAQNHLIEETDTDSMGELCVRGSIIAYGYYHNEEKTNEVFVQNPLNSMYKEVIYRTGDLVKYNEYGELMYAGRKDFQVKVSGYRIELGEIETAVSAIPEVKLNCCLFDAKNQLLVLFYEGEIEKKELRSQLNKKIPRYMMPHKYIRLDQMPFNANGKIDRVSIKKIFFED